jgi:hypothetical protein
MNIGQQYNPFKMFYGCFIPNWLLQRTEITQGAKLCFARLAQYAGENGKCFPSIKTLANELGVKDRMIQNYLSELRDFKLIETHQTSGHGVNEFIFLWHEWSEPLHPPTQHIAPPNALSCTPILYNEENQLKESSIVNAMSFSQNQLNDESAAPNEINPKKPKEKLVAKDGIPYDEIKDLFNKILWDNFPTCQFIKPGSMRAKHVKARWEYELPTLEAWEKFFEQVKRSDFLCGKILNKQTGKPFLCNFDWLVNEANCAKILDDNYANERV